MPSMRTVLGGAVLAALLLAAPAAANRNQESIFQDDGVLQQSGPDAQKSALRQIRNLGADTVHVLVGWRRIAPSPTSRTKPSDFDASNPDAYPSGAFDTLDALVREARDDDLDVIFTPTSSIPDWASRCSAAEARKGRIYSCDPDPAEFQQFVTALGKHFSGDLAVRRWSIWNEPNFKSWLRPQFTKVHGTTVAYGAIMYRNLLKAGIAALQATGHGGDAVYGGETGPIGQTRGGPHTTGMAPGLFVRRMLCLNDSLRRLSGSDSRAYQCTRTSKLAIKGFAHHPYTRGGSLLPTSSIIKDDEITLKYIGRLERILSAAGRYKRIPSATPIYDTEYGLQTDPPDEFFGLSLGKQAQGIDEADYMAWRNRRIRSVAQYNLIDDASSDGFNTGLVFNPNTNGGVEKPSYGAYRTPILVINRGSSVDVWGQARPAGTNQKVEIQTGSGDQWTTVQTVQTGTQGYFFVSGLEQQGASWRLSWTDKGGTAYVSREATPEAEPKFK
jgi:Cellulase (glycosyl hydrolase family 5)